MSLREGWSKKRRTRGSGEKGGDGETKKRAKRKRDNPTLAVRNYLILRSTWRMKWLRTGRLRSLRVAGRVDRGRGREPLSTPRRMGTQNGERAQWTKGATRNVSFQGRSVAGGSLAERFVLGANREQRTVPGKKLLRYIVRYVRSCRDIQVRSITPRTLQQQPQWGFSVMKPPQ